MVKKQLKIEWLGMDWDGSPDKPGKYGPLDNLKDDYTL